MNLLRGLIIGFVVGCTASIAVANFFQKEKVPLIAAADCAIQDLNTGALPQIPDGSYRVFMVANLYDSRTGDPIYVMEALGGGEIKLYRIEREKVVGLTAENIPRRANTKVVSLDVRNGKAWVTR